MKNVLHGLFLIVCLVGCSPELDLNNIVGGDAGPTPSSPGSCRAADGAACVDYVSVRDANETRIGCENLGNTFSTGECATAGRVARCTSTSDGVTSVKSYYAPNTVADAMSECSLWSGMFEAN